MIHDQPIEPAASDLPYVPPEPAIRFPVPLRFRSEYYRLLREGFTDRDAQSLLALHHGLGPVDGQREPWTLAELAQLEFAAQWTRR